MSNKNKEINTLYEMCWTSPNEYKENWERRKKKKRSRWDKQKSVTYNKKHQAKKKQISGRK